MERDDDFGINSGSAYLFDVMTGERLAKLLASNGAQSDGFCISVALNGTTAVVRAPGNTDGGISSGTAYLFDTITGQQTAKLQASGGGWGDGFGFAVAVSGTTAIVGAERDNDLGGDSGSAYVFSTEFIGSSYCTSNENSFGQRAAIEACGSASIADNDLVLTARMVPNQLYLFFHGQNQIQVPFGDGFLCAGGNTFRLNTPAMAQDYSATLTVDVPLQVGAPGTLHFQCWFRDPHHDGAGFNLSNGVSVTFTL